MVYEISPRKDPVFFLEIILFTMRVCELNDVIVGPVCLVVQKIIYKRNCKWTCQARLARLTHNVTMQEGCRIIDRYHGAYIR